jgi:hypothetical protein
MQSQVQSSGGQEGCSWQHVGWLPSQGMRTSARAAAPAKVSVTGTTRKAMYTSGQSATPPLLPSAACARIAPTSTSASCACSGGRRGKDRVRQSGTETQPSKTIVVTPLLIATPSPASCAGSTATGRRLLAQQPRQHRTSRQPAPTRVSTTAALRDAHLLLQMQHGQPPGRGSIQHVPDRRSGAARMRALLRLRHGPSASSSSAMRSSGSMLRPFRLRPASFKAGFSATRFRGGPLFQGSVRAP